VNFERKRQKLLAGTWQTFEIEKRRKKSQILNADICILTTVPLINYFMAHRLGRPLHSRHQVIIVTKQGKGNVSTGPIAFLYHGYISKL
jgi:hypothetical protein